MEDDYYTFEQNIAATLIEMGEALPITLIAKLIEQGVIIDEFITSHLNQ